MVAGGAIKYKSIYHFGSFSATAGDWPNNKKDVTMFNMYRRQFYRRSRLHAGSEEELGHDRFNYMNPNVNYDKWPRRLRPKKNSLKVELEAPESPHNMQEQHHQYASDATHNSTTVFNCETTYPRHCNGSLREHQRLLNLRSSRHKCSPRCRVKVILVL